MKFSQIHVNIRPAAERGGIESPYKKEKKKEKTYQTNVLTKQQHKKKLDRFVCKLFLFVLKVNI